jgi:hypothetical protein
MALIFVLVYLALHKGIHVTGRAAKGAYFGLLMFFISGISGALAMYLMFNLPLMLILLWTAEDLVIKVIGGMAVAGLIKD